MAKKKKAGKKGFPSKQCPKCNKTLHAAKRACSCGFEFPAKKKKRKRRAKKAAPASKSVSMSQKLAESIRVVEKAGGIDSAKQMLSAVKELEKLS